MNRTILLFPVIALAISGATAKAASVAVDFPAAGDGWCDVASATCGTLNSGGLTGELKSEHSFITSKNIYPVLNNFVATGISVNMNYYNTGYAVIDYFAGGEEFQYVTVCCGTNAINIPTVAFATPTMLSPTSSFSFVLDSDIDQTNMASGNWIQFGGGTITLTGYYATPELSTWAMLLLGFAGLGFVGYRAAMRAEATASV
jgi:hypothetical protein